MQAQDTEPLVWVVAQSLTGGIDYTVTGVYVSREAALENTRGVIHSGAGRDEAHGGIGWKLPDGTRAFREQPDGSLYTYDATIDPMPVEGKGVS